MTLFNPLKLNPYRNSQKFLNLKKIFKRPIYLKSHFAFELEELDMNILYITS